MLSRLAIAVFFLLITLIDGVEKPLVTILVQWSSKGFFYYGLHTDLMVKLWAKHLKNKFDTDPNWPFQAKIEIVDIQSNFTFAIEHTMKRLLSIHLPPVNFIALPENPVGYTISNIARMFRVPTISIVDNANSTAIFPAVSNSFSVLPPAMYMFQSATSKLLKVGVKTVVVVSAIISKSIKSGYAYSSCITSAKVFLVPKGVKILKEITYNPFFGLTQEYMTEVAQSIKDLNPDAVMWCDASPCWGLAPKDYFSMALFKSINYSPKALVTMDCTGQPNTKTLTELGFFDYLLQPTYYHPKLKGNDFTNDAYPYSNYFRPKNKVETMFDAVNQGSLDSSPSSSTPFHKYIINSTGNDSVQYQTAGMWAAFELLESAMYRATQNPVFMSDGRITGQEIFAMMEGSQMSGPFGRAGFDDDRINTYPNSLLLQVLNRNFDYDIVYPVGQITHEIVYPMPTWEERVYTWSLMKGNVGTMIPFVSVLSGFIVLTLLTIFWVSKKKKISAMQITYMTMVCVSCLITMWSLVFVWQADTKQIQCDAYLWTSLIPISLVISLLSMKAYRMSVFRTSNIREEKQKWTHRKVILYALVNVCVVSLILLISTRVDAPKSSLVVIDEHRPKVNYYTCQTGSTTSSILYVLFAYHVALSLICTIRVRNGIEMFAEGTALKECFIVFYVCVLIVFAMESLSLSNQTTYSLRVCFISMGLLFVVMRLMGAKYLSHWVPEIMLYRMSKIYQRAKYIVSPTTEEIVKSWNSI